jgi:hypothetical protein
MFFESGGGRRRRRRRRKGKEIPIYCLVIEKTQSRVWKPSKHNSKRCVVYT